MWETLKNAILFLPYALIALLLLFGVATSYAFAWLTGFILDVSISPTLISLSYTNPAGNQIIKLGLGITQNFVNLILVLALVYTALSIALRINETAAKKMLARLIIVALLVNFAPVFCGLVVDAANIVMYYFLEPIKEGVSGVLLQISTLFDMVKETIWGAKADLVNRLGVIMMGITQIIINFAMGIAFFLFAGIFLVRYIAIWALVILAPIAFVAWIFPPGRVRAFWDMWLNNFIEWSIIGIPIAFFLYLAMGSFSLMTAAFKTKIEMPGIEAIASGYFNQVFPYFVVIVFLFLGFTIGLQTGAMGGSATISLTKRGGIRTGRWAERQARRGGRQLLSRVTRGREEAVRKWAEKQAAVRIGETFGTGRAGRIASHLGWAVGATPIAWAVRRGIGEAFLKLKEAEEKEIKEGEKKYEGTNVERKGAAITNRFLPATERISALRKVVDENQIDDLREYLGRTGLSPEQINAQFTSLMREALRIHPDVFSKLRDAFPHLAEQAGQGFSEIIKRSARLSFKDSTEAAQYGNSITAMITAKMRPVKIPQIDTSVFEKTAEGIFKNKDISWAIHKFWTGEHVGSAARNFGRLFIEPFHKEAERAGHKWYQENENPRLSTYLKSSAAQGLGLGPIPEEGKGPFPTPSPPPPKEAPPAPPTPPPPPRGRPGVGGPPTAPPRGRPGVGEATIVTPSEATIRKRTLTEE